MSRLLLIAAVLAHGHLPAAHPTVPLPFGVRGQGEAPLQLRSHFSAASSPAAAAEEPSPPRANPGFLSTLPKTSAWERKGHGDGGLAGVAVGPEDRDEDVVPEPPFRQSVKWRVHFFRPASPESAGPSHSTELGVPRMLSSADAQVELKTPLTDSGQAQLSLSSPVTEIAASLDTGELDTGTGHPEETSKPPEVNVSQVWVQDSPQDYINDGELNSSSDPHMADLTTVTAALQQIKVWMTSRLEELDSELLEQWQDIEAGRQLEDRLRKLITASPCVESLEQQLLKYGKNSMKQDTLLWGLSAATRHA